MLRELAGMSKDEAFKWSKNRRAEAMHAMMAGTISEDVGNSILEWADDAYTDYLAAVDLGYVPLWQVDGERMPS